MDHPNDRLTGLPGGAALKEELQRRLERQEQLAIAVMDVDRFANLNHDLWHVAGDEMLRQLARLLAEAAAGTVYRTGGGEFTLVMGQMTLEQAQEEAARLRELVSAYDFALADGRAVTLTAGVAQAPLHAADAQGLLGTAAAALLDGKREKYLRRVALGVP